MFGDHEKERIRQKLKRDTFRQTHGGKDQFRGGEWGNSSEFGRNNFYHESDSFDHSERHHYAPRRYTIDGVDFDPDERDEESYSREFQRTRFAQPYSEDHIHRSRYSVSSENHSGKGPIGYKREDKSIYEDVCEALFVNPSVDATDIKVSVSEGLVTLRGSVKTRFEKREAERCIEDVSGVIDIHNDLRLAKNSDSPSRPEP